MASQSDGGRRAPTARGHDAFADIETRCDAAGVDEHGRPARKLHDQRVALPDVDHRQPQPAGRWRRPRAEWRDEQHHETAEPEARDALPPPRSDGRTNRDEARAVGQHSSRPTRIPERATRAREARSTTGRSPRSSGAASPRRPRPRTPRRTETGDRRDPQPRDLHRRPSPESRQSSAPIPPRPHARMFPAAIGSRVNSAAIVRPATPGQPDRNSTGHRPSRERDGPPGSPLYT